MIEIAFGFLWFHRNFIFAAIGIYICYRVVIASSDKVAETRIRDRTAEKFVIQPRPVNTPSARNPSRATTATAEPDASRNPLVDDKVPGVSDPGPSVQAEFTLFLQTSNAEQLLDYCKNADTNISDKPPVTSLAGIKRRLLACRQLRTLPLTEEQLTRTDVFELEARSQLNGLNVQHGLGLPDSRSKLLTLAQQLSAHSDVKVAAKANLALIATEGVDILLVQISDEVLEFEEAYQRHIDPVLKVPGEAVVIATLMQRILLSSPYDPRLRAIHADCAQRLRAKENEDLRSMGDAMSETAAYSTLGLDSLLTRMNVASETTLADIDKFFATLADHPTSRKDIYKIALAVVGKHIKNKEYERAASSLAKLKSLQPTIEDEVTKTFVSEMLTKLTSRLSSVDAQ